MVISMADYVEKIILASIKYFSECSCPVCLVKKSQISQLGTIPDMRLCIAKQHVNSQSCRNDVEQTHSLVCPLGIHSQLCSAK
ncbi:hypothetical protein Moror_5413 [Moniliophthora roreri MCA 2997]|uniref:Uncharacterized protein n=1 Tax=Moniliophthora roreri (strain MCA 2997) TaxID=1381753 RepID=V2XSL4_MONRO|nr:hypothetical protein Moror_5413 [Moniliophthora roreri MCA 2997]